MECHVQISSVKRPPHNLQRLNNQVIKIKDLMIFGIHEDGRYICWCIIVSIQKRI